MPKAGQVWTTAEAADNTSTVITITPPANKRVALHFLLFGYDKTLTTTPGRLTITIDGVEVLSVPVTQAGPGPLELPEMAGDVTGDVMVITLTTGGTAVQGSLTSMHTLEY
jgi:hypothetical protein